MNEPISTSVIQSTYTFIMLGESTKSNPKLNNKITQQMLLKRKTREKITHVFNVYKNTGVMESILTNYELAICQELIDAAEKDKTKMTVEQITEIVEKEKENAPYEFEKTKILNK